MPRNVAQKLIADHLLDGEMNVNSEVALRIDQTLTQDATGTMVMLQLEALELDRVQTELSVQYVDHNLVQEDHRNADDHRFLYTAAQRFGLWYSPAGNGVSHPTHMQRFGIPGKSMLGADSHTPAAGSLGMLAMGAGGIDVALAMAGRPFRLRMPEIWGVRLSGELSPWVSAKDVILEMLRRHGTDGARGRIIEYYGPGLAGLSAMDRHVIANMGAELGATTTVFPSDDRTRDFLASCGREECWQELVADDGCRYDMEDALELDAIVPLIARPGSPGNVVPVEDVVGEAIAQAYIGSSANPGYRDFAVCAQMVRGKIIPAEVSFDINPTSRALLELLSRDGHLGDLIAAGARIHQAGCNGCIGMGQAPATEVNSLRTTPRNFTGRSGTREDRVWLCSPETATASALCGRIADPRECRMDAPRIAEPAHIPVMAGLLIPPSEPESQPPEVIKGPNIASLPELAPVERNLSLPILLKVGDLVTTDHIMPAGARVLPFRSNIPRIADFVFEAVDPTYVDRARQQGDHAILAGRDYGQGSSREHAALAPRQLGLRLVVAESFARIHWQNLVSYGIVPLEFSGDGEQTRPDRGDVLEIRDLPAQLRSGEQVEARVGARSLQLIHRLSPHQVEILLAGGVIPWMRRRG